MGRLHSASYLRVPYHYPESAGVARLVVAADEVEARARQAAEQLGYARWTTNWRDVIEDPEVEAVSITAPNFMHREMALAAAKARKHFWGEKPLGRFPAETAEIAAAAGRAGIRTIVGLNYRHPPAVQYARRLIADGALGEITHFRMQFVASYSSNPQGALSWRFERMNELQVYSPLPSGDSGYARVLMGPGHPEFVRFQPGQGIPMGYDDLKVIEAHLFLESIVDGVQREPGVREIDAAARVIDAMVRSAESGSWDEVRR